MWRSWSLFLLVLPLGRYADSVLIEPAANQAKDDAKPPPDDDPAAPDKLGKLTLTIDPGRHNSTVLRAFFNPSDGNQLITLANDGAIRLWDLAEGRTTSIIYPPGIPYVKPAAMSKDGKRLAVPSRYFDKGKEEHVVYVLSLPDGRLERTLRGNFGPVSALAFSPDGTRLALSRRIEPPQRVRLWDLTRDAPPELIGKGKRTVSMAFSPDGKRLACGDSRGSVSILDLGSGKEIGIQGQEVVWSPDGKTIATAADADLRLHDSEGRLLHASRFKGGSCTHLTFGPDSKTVLFVFYTSNNGQRAILMDVASGKEVLRFQPKPSDHSASGALSPDGQLAATVGGSSVSEIIVWRTKGGEIYRELKGPAWFFGGANYVKPAWSKDGKAVSWCAPWVLGNGYYAKQPLLGLATFHLGELQFVKTLQADERHKEVTEQDGLTLKRLEYNLFEVVKDGKTVVSKVSGLCPKFVGQGWVAVVGGRHIRLVNALTGKEIRRLSGDAPIDLGFSGGDRWGMHPSPDNRFLMTLHVNQTQSIWTLEQEKPLLTLYRKGQDWVIWTEEGYYAATPGGERLIGWKVDNGIDKATSYYPAERFRKQLYRPDVIKKAFELGSVEAALKALDGAKAKLVDLEKLLPPKCALQLLEQKDGVVKLKASAAAATPTQPVTSLYLMLDGRPWPGAAKDFKAGDKPEAEWTINMPEGEHQLVVLAKSPDASAKSNTISPTPVLQTKLPVLHVLAIGIDAYQDKNLTLKAAAADARAITAAFKNSCAGPNNLFQKANDRLLVNDKANRQGIRDALDDIRKQGVKQNDLVVVFFAGHGIKEKKAGGEELYLLTVEADVNKLADTALSGAELHKKLSAIPCQVLLMLDACHSAAALQAFKPATDDVTRKLTDDECAVVVMCAAMGYEKAQERPGNGLFTKHVVAALSDKQVQVHPRNHRQYIHHLQSYVFDHVSDESGDKQHPFLSLPWMVESFALRQLPEK